MVERKPQLRRLKRTGPPWDQAREIVAGAQATGYNQDWDVFLHFIPQADGRLYLFGLDIRPKGLVFTKSMRELPPRGITARVVRSIKLGEILADLRTKERLYEPEPDFAPSDLPPPGTRPGRRGNPDDWYAHVAVLYLKAANADPRAPIRWMERAMGKHYPRDTIKGWVVEARKRGFLTPTSHGQAGGEAGPRLPDLLPDWERLDDSEARDRLAAIHTRL